MSKKGQNPFYGDSKVGVFDCWIPFRPKCLEVWAQHRVLHFRAPFECYIDNEVIPIEFDVRKLWFDEHLEFHNSLYARARYDCQNEAQINSPEPYGYGGNTLWFEGLDDHDHFDVYPNYNGTTVCSVTEKVRDSSVESDESDCQEVKVLLGEDKQPSDR